MAGYTQIDQETARLMMRAHDDHVVVDVRRSDEYAEGHIPGAVLIPNETISDEPPERLPDPDQVILVYCRSGNRSKQAAEKLAKLGYTNVYEFGGIQDWTGEVVTGQTVAVTVESNPTTGFCWTVAQDQELFDVRDVYASEYHEEPLAGGGGWQTFILSPKEAGEVVLTFTYSRSWEQSEFDTQFVCRFAVFVICFQ